MPAVGDDADALCEPEDDALYDGAPEPECGAEGAPSGADADEAALDAAGHGSSGGQFSPPSASTGGPPSAAAGLLSAAAAAAAAAPPSSLPLVDRAMLRRMVSAAAAIVGPPAPRAGALRAEDGAPHDPASSSSDDAARVRRCARSAPARTGRGGGAPTCPCSPGHGAPPRPLDVGASGLLGSSSSAPACPCPSSCRLPPDPLRRHPQCLTTCSAWRFGRGAGALICSRAALALRGSRQSCCPPASPADHGPAPPIVHGGRGAAHVHGRAERGPPAPGMDSSRPPLCPPPPALGPPSRKWPLDRGRAPAPLVQQPSLKALPPLHPARGPSCSEAPQPPAPQAAAPQPA